MQKSDIIVICTKCGALCPSSPSTDGNPWPVYRWRQPCPNCGAEAWAAHETCRDWQTGRTLD